MTRNDPAPTADPSGGGAARRGKRPVVLSGDSHDAWHSQRTLQGLVDDLLWVDPSRGAAT